MGLLIERKDGIAVKHIILGRPAVFKIGKRGQDPVERCYFCDKPPTGACRNCGAHVCDDHTEHQSQSSEKCPPGSVCGIPQEEKEEGEESEHGEE